MKTYKETFQSRRVGVRLVNYSKVNEQWKRNVSVNIFQWRIGNGIEKCLCIHQSTCETSKEINKQDFSFIFSVSKYYKLRNSHSIHSKLNINEQFGSNILYTISMATVTFMRLLLLEISCMSKGTL